MRSSISASSRSRSSRGCCGKSKSSACTSVSRMACHSVVMPTAWRRNGRCALCKKRPWPARPARPALPDLGAQPAWSHWNNIFLLSTRQLHVHLHQFIAVSLASNKYVFLPFTIQVWWTWKLSSAWSIRFSEYEVNIIELPSRVHTPFGIFGDYNFSHCHENQQIFTYICSVIYNH
jgi:hypothetical protein